MAMIFCQKYDKKMQDRSCESCKEEKRPWTVIIHTDDSRGNLVHDKKEIVRCRFRTEIISSVRKNAEPEKQEGEPTEQTEPVEPTEQIVAPEQPVKRKRGRPRKYPLPEIKKEEENVL